MRRRQRRSSIGCVLWVIPACLTCVVVGLLLAPALPGLALRVAGFAPQGSVDDFWARQRQDVAAVQPIDGAPPIGDVPAVEAAQPAMPAPGASTLAGGAIVAQAQPINYASWFAALRSPSALVVNLSGRSTALNAADLYAAALWIGDGTDGAPLGVARFEEDSLPGICATWLAGCATSQYRVTRVDFRPGGVMLYGSVNLAGLWQEAGIALTLTPDGIGFTAAGLVLNGTLYAVPQAGEIADLVNRLVGEGNTALRNVTVQAEGYALRIVEVHASESDLVIILR